MKCSLPKLFADRIYSFLDQGKIAEEGTAQAFFTNPQTKRAQEFLNVFDFSQFWLISIKEILMKLFKPLLTVLALAFALIFVTACSSGGNAGSSSGKTTAKLAQSMKSKKAVSYESPCLEIKNRLVTLTMTVLTKVRY